MKTGSTVFLADYTPEKELRFYFSYSLYKLVGREGIKTRHGIRAQTKSLALFAAWITKGYGVFLLMLWFPGQGLCYLKHSLGNQWPCS